MKEIEENFSMLSSVSSLHIIVGVKRKTGVKIKLLEYQIVKWLDFFAFIINNNKGLANINSIKEELERFLVDNAPKGSILSVLYRNIICNSLTIITICNSLLSLFFNYLI